MDKRRQDSGQGVPRSTDKVDGWLASARGPAFVIAPGDASLIAANPAGALLLGLEEKLNRPVPLDSAMPAIMDLRRTINRGARGREPTTPLVFWTTNGIARLHCHVEMVANEGDQRLVLVEVASETAAAMERPAVQDLAPENSVAGSGQPPQNEAGTEHAAPPSARPAGTAATPTDPLGTDASRAVTASPAAATHAGAQDRRNPSAPSSALAGGGRDRPGPRPHPSAVSAMPPPTPPPQPARSDDETLKAIARQILAGRRAASKGTDSAARKSAEARPVGATEHRLRDTTSAAPAARSSPAARPASSAAPGSIAAAKHTPSKDVRRAEPGTERVPAKSKPQTPAADLPVASAQSGRPPHKPVTDGPPVQAGDEAERGGSGSGRPTRARRVAHELKTPLSAIVSAAEVMKDQRLGAIGDDRYLRYAQDIYESARHALAVIERMLGQPRKEVGEAGDRELSFTDLDLNTLAAGLLSGLEAMAREAGLALTSDLASRLPLVVADATSIRQILLNLLTNALKFTPRGGKVQLTTRIDETGQLTLSVSDTGPGISAEAMAHIATTSDAAETPSIPQQRPGGGLGIGLPLAQALASANGASLTITARDGGGTLATLTFPSSRQVPI